MLLTDLPFDLWKLIRGFFPHQCPKWPCVNSEYARKNQLYLSALRERWFDASWVSALWETHCLRLRFEHSHPFSPSEQNESMHILHRLTPSEAVYGYIPSNGTHFVWQKGFPLIEWYMLNEGEVHPHALLYASKLNTCFVWEQNRQDETFLRMIDLAQNRQRLIFEVTLPTELANPKVCCMHFFEDKIRLTVSSDHETIWLWLSAC